MTYIWKSIGYNTAGQWILFLIIGLAIGWVAGVMIRGRSFGIIIDVVIGIIGAMLGGWVAGIIGLSEDNLFAALLLSLTIALVLVILVRFFARKIIS